MSAKTKNGLDKSQAARIALSAQGLIPGGSFGKGKAGTLSSIQHLGYLQLDTLAVVTRAHHHTLWTRADAYAEKFLGELMLEKKIFEYWSHAAAYLPMDDFRFSLVRKNEFRKGRAHWFARDKKMHRYVRDKIKSEGALQAKDFEAERKHGSWFDWKPAKIALEQLFQDGTLMVSERKGFQKVYDLTERVLPVDVDTTLPSREEFADYLIRSTLRAHGLATHKDITHLQKGMRQVVEKQLKKLLKEGEIVPVNVEGVKEDYFILPDTLHTVNTVKPKIISAPKASILSPFDNLVIRRERLQKLFAYDYQLECYLPEHKRKFGYFCLPVLYNNEFVAKFDPKANRATGIFYVKSFYLEHAPKDMDAFLNAFAKTLKAFAHFNACDEIIVERTYPVKLKTDLKKALSAR